MPRGGAADSDKGSARFLVMILLGLGCVVALAAGADKVPNNPADKVPNNPGRRVTLEHRIALPTEGNAGFEAFQIGSQHYIVTANFW